MGKPYMENGQGKIGTEGVSGRSRGQCGVMWWLDRVLETWNDEVERGSGWDTD